MVLWLTPNEDGPSISYIAVPTPRSPSDHLDLSIKKDFTRRLGLRDPPEWLDIANSGTNRSDLSIKIEHLPWDERLINMQSCIIRWCQASACIEQRRLDSPAMGRIGREAGESLHPAGLPARVVPGAPPA